MTVGLDTSSAGAKTGSVDINYVSDGAGTSGLAAIAAGSQTINLSGDVYRLASANTLGAVSFGNVHVGDSVQQALGIINTAVNDGFSEKLNASFGGATDSRITTNGGSIIQLGAGASDNVSMIVGLDTSAAGTVNGTQTVLFASDGTGTSGLGITGLPSQGVNVSGDITTSGSVYRLASASPAAPNPVNFGNVRIGTATDQALTISNTALNDGFSEKLNASITSNGTPVTASGAFTLLGPQETNNTSLRRRNRYLYGRRQDGSGDDCTRVRRHWHQRSGYHPSVFANGQRFRRCVSPGGSRPPYTGAGRAGQPAGGRQCCSGAEPDQHRC